MAIGRSIATDTGNGVSALARAAICRVPAAGKAA